MNWTNEEQSRYLVELGLDTNTADMCLVKNPADEFRPVCGTVKYVTDLREQTGYKAEIIPCWSVGALLEVMPFTILDNKYHFMLGRGAIKDWAIGYVTLKEEYFTLEDNNLVEAAYNMIVWLLENNYIKH